MKLEARIEHCDLQFINSLFGQDALSRKYHRKLKKYAKKRKKEEQRQEEMEAGSLGIRGLEITMGIATQWQTRSMFISWAGPRTSRGKGKRKRKKTEGGGIQSFVWVRMFLSRAGQGQKARIGKDGLFRQ